MLKANRLTRAGCLSGAIERNVDGREVEFCHFDPEFARPRSRCVDEMISGKCEIIHSPRNCHGLAYSRVKGMHRSTAAEVIKDRRVGGWKDAEQVHILARFRQELDPLL